MCDEKWRPWLARDTFFSLTFQERNFFLLAFYFSFFPSTLDITAEPTADGHRTSLIFSFPFPKKSQKRVKRQKRILAVKRERWHHHVKQNGTFHYWKNRAKKKREQSRHNSSSSSSSSSCFNLNNENVYARSIRNRRRWTYLFFSLFLFLYIILFFPWFAQAEFKE